MFCCLVLHEAWLCYSRGTVGALATVVDRFHIALESFPALYSAPYQRFEFGAGRMCSGPREDATRIGSAGVIRRQAVDISPLRRVNQAIYLLTTGARESSFRNIKTISECLADELINAAKGSSNS